jgi:hypothetical protein
MNVLSVDHSVFMIFYSSPMPRNGTSGSKCPATDTELAERDRCPSDQVDASPNLYAATQAARMVGELAILR